MRWIIDRLEDALAMCEDEKGELIPISRDKLPENAREGDVLREEGGHFSLSPEEAQQLLKLTGYPPLYVKVERDNAILFGLQKGLDIISMNSLLYELHLELLV